jgi:arsenate reductase (thioredoxin)
MAEGWAKALCNDRIEAHSAGTQPHGLNPIAVKVMAEVGVDIAGHTSKSVDDLVGRGVRFDVVITVCGHAHETCPVFAGHGPGQTTPRIVHVGFDDPPKLAESAATEEEAIEHYRRVRDEIRAFVAGLPGSLDA